METEKSTMEKPIMDALCGIALNNDEKEEVRLNAIEILVKENSPEARASLAEVMENQKVQISIRNAAAKAIGLTGIEF